MADFNLLTFLKKKRKKKHEQLFKIKLKSMQMNNITIGDLAYIILYCKLIGEKSQYIMK